MKRNADAFGQMLVDSLTLPAAREVIERDDGYVTPGVGPGMYLSPRHKWPAYERAALRYVRGRVLDIGCGAGRVALDLQRRGIEVVGIDLSPLAIEAARRRGLHDARVLPIERIDGRLGRSDTFLLLGNNFGLLQSRSKAPRLLRRLTRVATEGARIIATTFDPYRTKDAGHRRYHDRNRRRGRMGGQIRLRVRYRDLATAWADYLFVSRDEMRELLRGTGWRIRRLIAIPPRSSRYAAIIERVARPRV